MTVQRPDSSGRSQAIDVLRETLRVPRFIEPAQVEGLPAAQRQILGSYLGSYKEGIAVIAPDGRFRLFTPSLEEICGFAQAEIADIGDGIRRISPDPETETELTEAVGRAFSPEGLGEQLVRIRHKDGTPRWLRVSAYRANEDIVVHVLDLSAVERQPAPEAGTDAQLRDLLADLDVGLVMLDDPARGSIALCNPAARRVLGVPPGLGLSEISAFSFFEDPADRVRVLHALMSDGFAQSRTVRFETRVLRFDDRQPVELRVTATAAYEESGRMARLVYAFEDLGPRRRAEAQRARVELLLDAFFRGCSAGMVVGSVEGTFVAANESYCRMLGYREEELLGLPSDAVIHPEERGHHARIVRESLAAGRDTVVFPRRYLHRDGHTVPCQVALSAVRDPEGRMVAGIAMVMPT